MTEIDVIITQLEQAFRRRSWHGSNLLGSIRGIDPATAAWRPKPGRHNIWELIVHTAYWKYSVYRRLAGDPDLTFTLKGSNWIDRPAPQNENAKALKADITLLKRYHEKLIESVRQFPAKRLVEIPPGSKTTYLDLIIGVAAHDLYHAGQIQLLKRLQR